MGFDPGQSNLNTFFQHVTKFSCQLHPARPRHVGNFDEKNATLTSCTVGNQTGDNTRHGLFLRNFLIETFYAKDFFQVVDRDASVVVIERGRVFSISVLNGLVTAHRADLALQISYTRFSGV